MLFERLTLCDVGTFRGRQIIELTPRVKYGKSRTIVLFGGLNGAGKTTLLSSVRHVLYGRQSLDVSISRKNYDSVLRSMIHSPVGQMVKPDRAHVELQFVYSRLGQPIRYRVVRSWVDRGTSVTESLSLFQGDSESPLLEADGAQAFLNQLIPPGVSQFFFFDGEKIAALAKDDSDEVLADSIGRLLGLDVSDRLSSDLAVYLRNRRLKGLSRARAEELEAIYAEIESLKASIAFAERELQEVFAPELLSARQDAQRRKLVLTDQGGAWAVDRKALESSLDELAEKRCALEEKLRNDLSGPSVFALAPTLSEKVLDSVANERLQEDRVLAVNAVLREVPRLKVLLADTLHQHAALPSLVSCVDAWADGLSSNGAIEHTPPLHGFTGTDESRLRECLQKQVPAATREITAAGQQLYAVLAEITRVHDVLAHAPTDESINDAFRSYESATAQVAKLELRSRERVEHIREQVLQLVSLVRKARKLEEVRDSEEAASEGEELANRLIDMIGEFRSNAAAAKCKLLERYFTDAFCRLARKDDVLDHAVIDPSTFSVTLVDRHGRSMPKDRLASGEKQIFAIAMLEALAKASGRNLPIIIDTPLGRLDSQHRAKLVQSYFPYASHQVIVLSTDTEVDQIFYEGLRPNISHSFHLEFDSTEGCTSISEGYFWKNKDLANVA